MKSLDFDQSLCWIFNCCDSDLEALFWRYTYRDLTGRLKLKVGEFTTSHLQQAHGMIKVVAMVLGDGKPKERIIEDPAEFNRLMGG